MAATPVQGRLFAVLNAGAGSGRASRIWESVAQAWEAEGVEVGHARTREPGHAAELAEDAVHAGWPAVVAVGGDGTAHEVANGILRTTDPEGVSVPLGIVPCGSGNDFAKALGTARDPTAAARAIPRSRPRTVDAGRVNDRYFVNGVGVGFDARVAIRARGIPWLRGTPLYGLALLAELGRFRPTEVRVRLDGKDALEGSVTLLTVSNGPSHGGGFLLCPAAVVNDGQLDVLLAAVLPRHRVLHFLVRSLKGTHAELAGIDLRRATRVEIESEHALPVHVDGELLDETVQRLDIEVLPRKLRVLA